MLFLLLIQLHSGMITKLWKKVGAVGEQLGLRWGGRWRNPYDPGHFEWTGGLSSYHLSNGLLPYLPKSYNNRMSGRRTCYFE
jgi:hypothetical protein